MKERVVIAMSGGVDSSVAAALLQRQGYEVIGVTMSFDLSDSAGRKLHCCGKEGMRDARQVARKLGIKHYVVDMRSVLEDKIINDFCREYLKGRTPNPCVRCNQYIKFGALLKKIGFLKARYFATGHYARIMLDKGKYQLRKARDLRKDQSYFLYRLKQEQLKNIVFPLGDYTKDRVRVLAKEFSLPVADKSESQEICFLPGNDYRGFLKANRDISKMKSGPVVNLENKVLGAHQGIGFYTIGQREGLGIALGYPAYVVNIDRRNNRITIGKKNDAYKKAFFVKGVHFLCEPVKRRIAVNVKIRYNHQESPAELIPLSNKVKVCFKKPQFAVTPGQSAVFYNKDRVLGGGIIDEVLNYDEK